MRHTEKEIEYLLGRLAIAWGVGDIAYTKQPDGQYKAEIGALTLDHNIGGYQVQQICNEGGGVCTPLGEYRFTKGELYYILRAAIDSARIAKNSPQTAGV